MFTIDVSDAGFSENDFINDSILRSPCANRPDTRRPCELFGAPKDNTICSRCRLRTGGTEDSMTTPTERTAAAKALIEYERLIKYEVMASRRTKKSTTCKYEGCDKDCNGAYCKKHRAMVYSLVKSCLSSPD